MKKRRGLGRCKVKEWQVWHFNLKNAEDIRSWLLFDREEEGQVTYLWVEEVVLAGEDYRE